MTTTKINEKILEHRTKIKELIKNKSGLYEVNLQLKNMNNLIKILKKHRKTLLDSQNNYEMKDLKKDYLI